MATAGRILIMPRGAYSSTTVYAPLDLVLHNGESWLCKKDSRGVEPSDNNEYWYRFTDVAAVLGAADISGIGDGTVRGAINAVSEAQKDLAKKDEIPFKATAPSGSTIEEMCANAKEGVIYRWVAYNAAAKINGYYELYKSGSTTCVRCTDCDTGAVYIYANNDWVKQLSVADFTVSGTDLILNWL